MAVTKTYLGNSFDNTNQTTYTFTGFTSAGTGTIVAMFWAQGGSLCTVSSATINGTSATIDKVWSATAQSTKACITHVDSVAAGTFSVSVTLSAANGTAPTCWVGVWLVQGHNTTPFHIPTMVGGTTTSDTISVNTKANGTVLFLSGHLANTAYTWNHATADLDTGDASTARRISFASIASPATETPHSEQASWTTSSGSFVGAISFQAGVTTTTDTITSGNLTLTSVSVNQFRAFTNIITTATLALSSQGVHQKYSQAISKTGLVLTAVKVGEGWRNHIATGYLTIAGAWHSPRPDTHDTVTNRKASKRMSGLQLNTSKHTTGNNDKVNNKWWASLLFGKYPNQV